MDWEMEWSYGDCSSEGIASGIPPGILVEQMLFYCWKKSTGKSKSWERKNSILIWVWQPCLNIIALEIIQMDINSSWNKKKEKSTILCTE